MQKIDIYDSTLRDGAQGPGISYSVEDKLQIVQKLDELGVTYIEAGNPGSNPKDLEFFERLATLNLRNASVVAFGSTRRVGALVSEDANVQSLIQAGTKTVAIFGKTWDFQVTDILKTTLEENLAMIRDTVSYLTQQGKRVVFDAEHFFDGYKENEAYAMEAIETAYKAGAVCICLCDTNGGTFPDEISKILAHVVEKLNVEVGIHCHNDNGMAVANTVMAVKAGARQVQGTLNGYGERCGNVNLSTVIPNLQLKLDYHCIPAEKLSRLTEVVLCIDELSNMMPDEKLPYVGRHAFSHKAGMHADAVFKNPRAYEHLSPESVGNQRTFLMSEVTGRTAILKLIHNVDPSITRESPKTLMILNKLKELEFEGYQYEGAESSFEIVIRKLLGQYQPFFTLENFKLITSMPQSPTMNSTAIIKIHVGERTELTASEGDGPVNALDRALRKALKTFYPSIEELKLIDFKVRVLDSSQATASKVRVLIQSSDGLQTWSTIGISTNIIDASWKALVDSFEYKLMLDMKNNRFKTLHNHEKTKRNLLQTHEIFAKDVLVLEKRR